MPYDLALFIGRFQPFHLGHRKIVSEALRVSECVLIMVGSAFEPRTPRNPWTYDERVAMIRSSFGAEENNRILCEPLMDVRYNDAVWITHVQRAVYDVYPEDDFKITLIGQREGGHGYFTSRFPQWEAVTVEPLEGANGLVIRNHLLGGGNVSGVKGQLGKEVATILEKFMSSKDGQYLKDEHNFIETYKRGWENAPFKPTHLTVDAVVIQSGHVLLVQRDARPGEGLWALPGGFIGQEEKLLDGAIRSLKEKTKIKVPTPVLYGSVKDQAVFDAPFRSDRGRTVTHAFHIELRGESELPKVKEGTNTRQCYWCPLAKLNPEIMFDDHYFIIQKMIGILGG